MSNTPRSIEAESVLLTFMAVCSQATADEVRAWGLRFPQFAKEIGQLAEISRMCGTYDDGETVELTPEQEARADARADAILDAAYARSAKPRPKAKLAPEAQRRWGMER